jgi:hypothetical protein
MAPESLGKQQGIDASKETVGRPEKPEKVNELHAWRSRSSRFGELVRWDTSERDWLEGRGEQIYLIAMIDCATSRLFARFVHHDSTETNMRLLRSYLEELGRPVAFHTDKAGLSQTSEPRKRDEPGEENDAVEMQPTQIGRALRELGITWIAHAPQIGGLVERDYGTAWDKLVKSLRGAGVKNIVHANEYLEEEYMAWWDRQVTVEPPHPDNAHRPLDRSHNLAASLSHVETRQMRNDYTVRWDGELYQIGPRDVVSGLRGAKVRVEQRLNGLLAVRYGEEYLRVTRRAPAAKKAPAATQVEPSDQGHQPRRGSDWNRNFDLRKGPKIWQAAQESGRRHGEW